MRTYILRIEKILKKVLDFESKRKYIAFMREMTKKKRNIITFYPDDVLKARIRRASKRHGRKVANMVSFIMNDWLDRDEGRGAGNTDVLGDKEEAEDSSFLGRKLPSFGRHIKARRGTGKVELAAAE